MISRSTQRINDRGRIRTRILGRHGWIVTGGGSFFVGIISGETITPDRPFPTEEAANAEVLRRHMADVDSANHDMFPA